MTTIFYIIGLMFVLYEFSWVFGINEKVEEVVQWDKLSSANKGKKWEACDPEFRALIRGRVFLLPIILYPFIGLFSAQWALFAILLIISLALSLLGKPFRFGVVYKVIHWVASLYGALLGLFIILNHCHLHIDTYQYFTNLITRN